MGLLAVCSWLSLNHICREVDVSSFTLCICSWNFKKAFTLNGVLLKQPAQWWFMFLKGLGAGARLSRTGERKSKQDGHGCTVLSYPQALLWSYHGLQLDSEAGRICPVIFVGDGRSGKSYLASCLVNAEDRMERGELGFWGLVSYWPWANGKCFICAYFHALHTASQDAFVSSDSAESVTEGIDIVAVPLSRISAQVGLWDTKVLHVLSGASLETHGLCNLVFQVAGGPGRTLVGHGLWGRQQCPSSLAQKSILRWHFEAESSKLIQGCNPNHG